jgi:hypothetical protein
MTHLVSSSSETSTRPNGLTSLAPNSIRATNRRPFWWSHQQERKLDQELVTAQKNLHDLQVLHRDTHQKCLDMHQLLVTTTKNKHYSKLSQQQLGKTFAEVYARHALTIETMAELVIGLRPLVSPPRFQSTIRAFLKSRGVLQLLCDHIVQLATKGKEHGAISVETDVSQLVHEAVTEAKHLCDAHFMTSPPVHINTIRLGTNDTTVSEAEDPILTATLVRPWLQYTLVELLKNSMAVTVERNRNHCICNDDDDAVLQDDDDDDGPLCPIFIHIQETSREVVVQILDQGGGLLLDESNNKNTDLFAFASCVQKWDRLQDQQTYAMVRSPLRGLGVGLSLSQIMMQQFGGQLQLQERDHPPTTTTESLESGMTATIVLPKDYEIPETGLWEPPNEEPLELESYLTTTTTTKNGSNRIE